LKISLITNAYRLDLVLAQRLLCEKVAAEFSIAMVITG
jgi:hypothetical protein